MTEVDDFRSAQQIHDLLRLRGQAVGLTTVYRTLQAMSADGDVDVIIGEDGSVWTCLGRGAGRWPTSESLLCDLTDLALARRATPANP